MNEPVIVRNNVSIAVVTLLQTIVPAVVAVVSLYALMGVFGFVSDLYWNSMALIVAMLTLIIPKTPTVPSARIFSDAFPLAITVLMRWAVLCSVLLAVAYATHFSDHFGRRVILTWAVVTPGLLVITTLVLHEMMRRLLMDPVNARQTVFVGVNDVSLELARQLKTNAELCMSVSGFFDDRGRDRLPIGRETKLLGKLSELAEFVKERSIQVIFIALPVRHIQRVTDLLDELRDTTASIYYVPDIFVFDLIQARTGSIKGIPVIAMCETPFYGMRGVAKRLTDVIVASAVMLLAFPLLLAIALAVQLTSKGPAIFRQRRYGLNGEEIVVYKFRTMRVLEDGGKITQATRDDPRITTIGKFLRKYSLDELPQLINVLQGRMSLVGPRPHAVAHNEMYRKLIKGYMVRHKVLPGITGLAQVNGLRGETRTLEEMEARVRYDLEYLRKWSIALDLRILVRTVARVLNDSKAF